MMNENDFGSEKVLRAINHLYMMQVCICIAALKELRSAELTDKNIILRAIMRDMPDCGICADLTAEDYGVDFWADRAEYVNESTFNLYVTQAEENVLWNIEKKGQKPGRLAVPQQRITVRGDGMGTAPVIPLAYLTVLSAKLVAMAFPNEQTAAELSDYDDERVMIVLGERLQTILEDLAGIERSLRFVFLWGRANEIPPRSQTAQKFSYHLVTPVTGANFLLKGSFSAFCVDLHSCR